MIFFLLTSLTLTLSTPTTIIPLPTSSVGPLLNAPPTWAHTQPPTASFVQLNPGTAIALGPIPSHALLHLPYLGCADAVPSATCYPFDLFTVTATALASYNSSSFLTALSTFTTLSISPTNPHPGIHTAIIEPRFAAGSTDSLYLLLDNACYTSIGGSACPPPGAAPLHLLLGGNPGWGIVPNLAADPLSLRSPYSLAATLPSSNDAQSHCGTRTIDNKGRWAWTRLEEPALDGSVPFVTYSLYYNVSNVVAVSSSTSLDSSAYFAPFASSSARVALSASTSLTAATTTTGSAQVFAYLVRGDDMETFLSTSSLPVSGIIPAETTATQGPVSHHPLGWYAVFVVSASPTSTIYRATINFRTGSRASGTIACVTPPPTPPPTFTPTAAPTAAPSPLPTARPTVNPTTSPTAKPTPTPPTSAPPTASPTPQPTTDGRSPTPSPTIASSTTTSGTTTSAAPSSLATTTTAASASTSAPPSPTTTSSPPVSNTFDGAVSETRGGASDGGDGDGEDDDGLGDLLFLLVGIAAALCLLLLLCCLLCVVRRRRRRTKGDAEAHVVAVVPGGTAPAADPAAHGRSGHTVTHPAAGRQAASGNTGSVVPRHHADSATSDESYGMLELKQAESASASASAGAGTGDGYGELTLAPPAGSTSLPPSSTAVADYAALLAGGRDDASYGTLHIAPAAATAGAAATVPAAADYGVLGADDGASKKAKKAMKKAETVVPDAADYGDLVAPVAAPPKKAKKAKKTKPHVDVPAAADYGELVAPSPAKKKKPKKGGASVAVPAAADYGDLTAPAATKPKKPKASKKAKATDRAPPAADYGDLGAPPAPKSKKSKRVPSTQYDDVSKISDFASA